MENKKYEIKDFKQLCNVVTNDNVQNLGLDVVHWLIHYSNIVTRLREANPEVCEGKSNWELLEASFTWVDDGKNDLLSTKVTNKDTGEIREFIHKKNDK